MVTLEGVVEDETVDDDEDVFDGPSAAAVDASPPPSPARTSPKAATVNGIADRSSPTANHNEVAVAAAADEAAAVDENLNADSEAFSPKKIGKTITPSFRANAEVREWSAIEKSTPTTWPPTLRPCGQFLEFIP